MKFIPATTRNGIPRFRCQQSLWNAWKLRLWKRWNWIHCMWKRKIPTQECPVSYFSYADEPAYLFFILRRWNAEMIYVTWNENRMPLCCHSSWNLWFLFNFWILVCFNGSPLISWDDTHRQTYINSYPSDSVQRKICPCTFIRIKAMPRLPGNWSCPASTSIGWRRN